MSEYSSINLDSREQEIIGSEFSELTQDEVAALKTRKDLDALKQQLQKVSPQ